MSLELCEYTRSIVGLAVKSCSKGIFAIASTYGKSPCFLRLDFLRLFGVDGTVSVFASVDVADFLERAF